MNNEKVLLWKDTEILRENYEYYNQFNFSQALGEAISKIISKYEADDYICSIVNVEILSKNSLKKLKEKRNKTYKKNIPFFVICKDEDYKNICDLGFSNKTNAFDFLNKSTYMCYEYSGLIYPDSFLSRFSYVTPLFYFLNEWRYENGVASIPDEVIYEKLDIVLNGNYALRLVEN